MTSDVKQVRQSIELLRQGIVDRDRMNQELTKTWTTNLQAIDDQLKDLEQAQVQVINPYWITPEWVRSKGACIGARQQFEADYPQGVPVNEDTMRSMLTMGRIVWLSWMIDKLPWPHGGEEFVRLTTGMNCKVAAPSQCPGCVGKYPILVRLLNQHGREMGLSMGPQVSQLGGAGPMVCDNTLTPVEQAHPTHQTRHPRWRVSRTWLENRSACSEAMRKIDDRFGFPVIVDEEHLRQSVDQGQWFSWLLEQIDEEEGRPASTPLASEWLRQISATCQTIRAEIENRGDRIRNENDRILRLVRPARERLIPWFMGIWNDHAHCLGLERVEGAEDF